MRTLIYTGNPLRRILPGGQMVERGVEFEVVDELADSLLQQSIFELQKPRLKKTDAPEED